MPTTRHGRPDADTLSQNAMGWQFSPLRGTGIGVRLSIYLRLVPVYRCLACRSDDPVGKIIAAWTDAVDVASRRFLWNRSHKSWTAGSNQAGFFLKEISAIRSGSYRLVGRCHLAPKPASRTRPRRIRPSIKPDTLSVPRGASANRKAKRFDLRVVQLANEQQVVASLGDSRASRRAVSNCSLLRSLVGEERTSVAPVSRATKGDGNGGHRVRGLADELPV